MLGTISHQFLPCHTTLGLGYCESVFRKSAHAGINCEQSSSALLRAEVGFVPQFVSVASGALGVKDLSISAPHPLAKSFDPGKSRGLCWHLLLLAGRQLGSFRNLPPAGAVGRLVVGRLSQAGRSLAARPLEKGRGPRLSRSAVSRQAPVRPAGRRTAPGSSARP